MKIEVTCNTCGKKITKYQSEVQRSNRFYCSIKCYHVEGEKNPNWQGGIAEKICQVCGKRYTPFRRGKVSKSRFCSIKCKNIAHSKEMSGEKHPLWGGRGRRTHAKCKYCGKEFKKYIISNTKYCSKECGYLDIRSKRRQKTCELCGKIFEVPQGKHKQKYCSAYCFNESSKGERVCINCGKTFISNISSTKRYCSRRCWGRARIGDKNSHWQGGISFIPYCPKFNELLKEKIRERDGRRCQLCGCMEDENGQKLSVHHVHYDKENCAPDLISLCWRCNLKANTNRDYYENFFMEKLKERGLLI